MTDRADEIQALMQKAHQALDDAQLLLEHDRTEAAINRLYYAAFDAARAALLTKDEAPSSHAGVKARVSYHFIRTELISRSSGRTLAEAETLRNRADYDAFASPDRASVEALLPDVEHFVAAVEALLP
jgi:hypothetical protein